MRDIIREYYLCIVVVKSKTDTKWCPFDKPDIIAEYTCPILIGNTKCIVAVKRKTDTKWCPFCQARHYCRIHVPDIITNREYYMYLCIVVVKRKTDIKWCPCARFVKPDIIAEYMCPILFGNTTYV